MAAPMPRPPDPLPMAITMAMAMTHARAAFASLLQFSLPPVPPFYAMWFEYHAGTRPELATALETAMAQGAVDEALMRELSDRFLDPSPEFEALGVALTQLSGTLKEALGTMASHGADSAAFSDALEELSSDARQDPQQLRLTLVRLAEEARLMTRRSREMGHRIAHSSQQIEGLRTELEDARRDAETDALTGLSNRRAFDDRLRRLVSEAEAEGLPVAVILIDIDHFKLVNDRFGHPVGDALLRRTASTLTALLGERGRVARFGGEEFAIALSRVNRAEVVELAGSLRQAVAAQSFALRTSGTRLGDVTVSVGLAMLRSGEDEVSLVERADAALYRAKQEGRNRCCTDEKATAPKPAQVWG